MKKLCLPGVVFILFLTPLIIASEIGDINPYVAYAEPFDANLYQRPDPVPGSVLIKAETFEEDGFSSDLWGRESGGADVYWDVVDCLAATGTHSAWCAAGGSEAPPPCYLYANNMNAWMIYGPFDLSDATDGYLDFVFYLQEELGYDRFFFGVSDDAASSWSGYWIDSNISSWTHGGLMFSNVPGHESFLGKGNVWVGFNFLSDSVTNHYGAYVDDMLIYKTIADAPTPTPIPGQPGVEITIPTAFVHPSEIFYIDAYVNVPSSPLPEVNLAVVLDIYGTYYFWPSWSKYPVTDWQYYSSFPVGTWYVRVLTTFVWPDTGSASASNLIIYGMLLDKDVTHVIGNYATVTWGYGP